MSTTAEVKDDKIIYYMHYGYLLKDRYYAACVQYNIDFKVMAVFKLRHYNFCPL